MGTADYDEFGKFVIVVGAILLILAPITIPLAAGLSIYDRIKNGKPKEVKPVPTKKFTFNKDGMCILDCGCWVIPLYVTNQNDSDKDPLYLARKHHYCHHGDINKNGVSAMYHVSKYWEAACEHTRKRGAGVVEGSADFKHYCMEYIDEAFRKENPVLTDEWFESRNNRRDKD